ncbi:MAG TPA: enolase C-terminal domain-like protein [Burkholderiales bacterium]|nr:enolase C-terminal domain-like protein [Burkholderiales bacterium]
MPIIEAIHTVRVLAPVQRPIRTASGDIPAFPLVLIDVVSDAGITGHAYAQVYLPALLPALEATVRALGELIKGRELVPRDVHAYLLKRLRLWGVKNLVGTAMGALDMAIWDAYARSRNAPLYAALGAAPRALKPYYSVGLYDAKAVVEIAEEAVVKGYPGLKIKVGFPTVEEDLAAVRAAKKVLGSRALMVDYNQSLSPAEAMHRCRVLDGEGLEWIEEPILADDYASYAALSQAIDTPIQLGENFNGPEEMRRALEMRATDYVMPDAQFIRGVTGWLEAAALAQVHAVEMSSHTFIEASAHLLCATPTAHWLEHMDAVGAMLRESFPLVNGTITPPTRPGVGMEWDPEAVERYRLR